MNARTVLLAAAVLAIGVALVFARPHPTPGPLLRDFEAYYAGAQTWNDGHDPYTRDVWQVERTVPGVNAARDETLPFVGPPYTLPLFALFARAPYEVSARIWSSVLGLSLVAVVLLSLRIARARIQALTLIAAAGLAIGFAPVTSALALGQAALPAFAGALLAVAALEMPLVVPLAGAFVALLQPNVAVGLAVLVVQRRGVMVLVLAATAAVAIAFASGAALARSYPAVLSAHALAERFLAIQQTPAAIAYGLGAQPARARIIGTLGAILALLAGAAGVIRLRTTAHRLAFASALLPFFATFFHEHDFLVAYAPALWCAIHARGRVRACAFVATLLVAVDWLGLAQRPDGLTQSALLACAAACCFLVLEPGPIRVPTTAALVFAAAAIAGTAIALAHPAPIWPDAMSPFQTAPDAGIAVLWQQEQARSGLAAANPWWAALRLFALAGCALLAYACKESPPSGEDSLATR